MRLILLLLVLLGSLGVGAPVRAQVYYLDLSSQLIILPVRTMHVEQVLDGRAAGTTSVGMVYRGLQNRPALVEFRRGLGPEMTEWMQRRLPATAGDHAVVLCVRQLRVSEVMVPLGEQAKAELALDVYVHLPDGYHFVRRLSGHYQQPGLEATALHAPNVARVLQNCLQLLASAPWQLAAQQPALRLEQLATDKPATLALPPVLRAALPAPGIYRTPAQFLANEPDTTLSLRTDTLHSRTPGWEGTTRVRPVGRTRQGSRVPLREVWGFSDGRQAYIRHGNAFRLLARQDDFYTFVSGAPLDVQVAQRRTSNTVMYGALGNLLTSDADDMTGRPSVYALDVRTGQTGPFPLPGQATPMDTAFVYVYRPAGGATEARRLLVNNQEVGWLRPGEFLEVPCLYLGRAVRFSLDQPDGPALLVVPDARAANYVRLTTQPTAYWEWMPARLGTADVDALEQLRKR
jgi:hypothetical protein